jgi:hypothetical protein
MRTETRFPARESARHADRIGYDDPSLRSAATFGHKVFMHALFALLAAIGITVAPHALEAQQNSCLTDSIMLNTGWNHATNSLGAIGTYTSYWHVISDPSPNTSEPRPASVILKHPAWANPQPNSQWLSAYPTNANDTNGTYTFEYCFCIGPNAKRPRLDFTLLADDSATVYLNGNYVGATTGGFTTATHITDFNAQHFLPGKNCMRVAVHNIGSVAMGFDISGFVIADGVGLVKPNCCDSTGSIIGMKFWDQNCNGKHDPGEPGLPGWTIKLSSGQQTVTDALGNYYFMNVAPGTYVVYEVNQPGWTQSTPANLTYTLTLAAGQVIPNIEFGNCKNQEKDTCLFLGDYSIKCTTIPGTNQTGYSLTAYLQSHLPCQQQSASIVGISPAGINITPGTFSISNVITPVNFTISGPGAVPGTTVAIAIKVCCPDAAGAAHCCTDTIRIKLPECPHDGCFRLGESTIECKQGPNGTTYNWCFSFFNQSNFTAYYFSIIPPAGVTVTPSTLLYPSGVPVNTMSPWQCVTIGGPNATQGSTLTFIVRMCDKSRQQCCTDSFKITLPQCPEPPRGCCDDFLKRFAQLNNSVSTSGAGTVGGLLWPAGPGSAPIVAASATVVSVSVNGQPAYGYMTAGGLGGFGLGTVPPPPVPYPFSNDITWGPAGPFTLAGAPFKLKIQFPPMAPHAWHDVIRWCIRFRFTDKNCVTCDTVICFSRDRYRFIILDPVVILDHKKGTEKGGSREIESVTGSAISGTLVGSDSARVQVEFPAAPAEVGQVKYIGLAITPEDSTVSIENGATSMSGYDLFFLNRSMQAYFQANGGQSLSLDLLYSGLGNRNALAHMVSFIYTVTDPVSGLTDTLSEDLRVVFHRGGTQGGDQLSTASTSLANVRTFAIHLRNANGSEQPIDRLLINTDGDAKIVAVGPTASGTQALLEFGSNTNGNYAGEDMTGSAVSVAPGAEHGPIYLTLAGVPQNGTTIHFVTLDADGATISEGDLALTSPLSSVKGDDGDASSSTMLRQSYPNPAAHSTTIGFTLRNGGELVTLSVHDAAGREVARLVDGETLSGGDHAVFFDTSNLASGTYYYTLQVGSTTESRSMQIVK